MFCENCGKIIPDGAMFCPDCGNRLKEKPKRKKKPIKLILLLAVIIILAVAAGTALKDWNYKTKYPAGYAMDKLVKNGAWNPSYTDDAAMNNYLHQIAFVCDGKDVYFQDNANYYHLTDNDSIYYMPRYAMKDIDGNEIEEEGIQGIFINNILYSNTDGVMSYLDKDNNINAWRMEFKISDYYYHVASEILPYDNGLYFLYDGTLYRCTYKNITAQSVSLEDGINWFSTDKEEVVFDEAEIRKFGIYADTIVMFGGDNSIWTLDISSGEAVCVLEGAQYREQCCSVADGYIYYCFTDAGWNEEGSLTDNGKTDYIGRVKFDGTDNEPKYFALVSVNNVFYMSDSYIYYLQYNELYDEYFLIQTPIEDTTKQTVLAMGEEHGLDEMVYNLYANDEWIYYVSTESGFWRAKIDGTLVEKLQEYNGEEKQEKNMIYPLKVEEYPSKFEIQQFTLSGNIDPDSVSGYCGDDSDPESISWTLTDGVLTISGNGAMADFSSQDNQPWKQQRNHITSVVVDQGITSIGNESFAGLSNVTKVTLADTVTKIGDRAFINTKIETISFPSNLASIGDMAFYNLSTLNGELHLPDGLVHVGEEAFAECSGLTGELHLPESMNTIGKGAFHGCGGLTGDLTIPGSVEYIDYSVFGDCTGLNGTLTLSEGVKNVEQNAFTGCRIQKIVLPDSLERITPTTFSQCDHVKEIVWNGTKKFDGYSYLPAIEEGTSENEWKEAYINYVNEHVNTYDSFGHAMGICMLVNINNDSIPELYINFESTAGGDVICTYYDGKVLEQPMWNYGFSYMEGQNIFRDAGGHMDVYYDKIYSIENGQFVLLHEGNYGAADNSHVQFDSDGYPIYDYYWDGTEVSSETEYMNLLNEVYNDQRAITPFDGAEYDSETWRYVGNGLCDYEEIIEAINTY